MTNGTGSRKRRRGSVTGGNARRWTKKVKRTPRVRRVKRSWGRKKTSSRSRWSGASRTVLAPEHSIGRVDKKRALGGTREQRGGTVRAFQKRVAIAETGVTILTDDYYESLSTALMGDGPYAAQFVSYFLGRNGMDVDTAQAKSYGSTMLGRIAGYAAQRGKFSAQGDFFRLYGVQQDITILSDEAQHDIELDMYHVHRVRSSHGNDDAYNKLWSYMDQAISNAPGYFEKPPPTYDSVEYQLTDYSTQLRRLGVKIDKIEKVVLKKGQSIFKTQSWTSAKGKDISYSKFQDWNNDNSVMEEGMTKAMYIRAKPLGCLTYGAPYYVGIRVKVATRIKMACPGIAGSHVTGLPS